MEESLSKAFFPMESSKYFLVMIVFLLSNTCLLREYFVGCKVVFMHVKYTYTFKWVNYSNNQKLLEVISHSSPL